MSEDMALLTGSAGTLRTLADGTVRVVVDFQPGDRRRVMDLFGEHGTPMICGRLTDAAALARAREETQQQAPAEGAPGDYGELANILHRSSFFRTQAVWEACGTDKKFQDWVRRQPSVVSGQFAYWDALGEGRSVFAHVRRVAEGAGTGIKPRYCGVPLTQEEHQRQHDRGESAVVPPQWFEQAQEWFERKRLEYVRDWCKAVIKDDLGLHTDASFKHIPPEDLRAWADERGVLEHLPAEYREAVS